ncbi:MAG: hypothetical protein ACLRSY_02875 [Acutalibacter sp.]
MRGQRHHLPLGGEDDGRPQRAVGRLLPSPSRTRRATASALPCSPPNRAKAAPTPFWPGCWALPGDAGVLQSREESYERLGTFGAPAAVSWADTGRGALLRRKADGRLELSAADGAANPYLAFSLLIYAGVDGVQRGLSPAGLETGQPLAATLGEAKARCKESAFLQGLLPREILRAYTGR